MSKYSEKVERRKLAALRESKLPVSEPLEEVAKKPTPIHNGMSGREIQSLRDKTFGTKKTEGKDVFTEDNLPSMIDVLEKELKNTYEAFDRAQRMASGIKEVIQGGVYYGHINNLSSTMHSMRNKLVNAINLFDNFVLVKALVNK